MRNFDRHKAGIHNGRLRVVSRPSSWRVGDQHGVCSGGDRDRKSCIFDTVIL